ncbi:MAG: LptF/LptG family permease [Flavobacteriaceae bacterium]
MKKLDIYIIKSFLKPFFATFFVILFVLVMVALWGGFDEISGKGVDMGFILKFVGYLALTVVPLAMPIGILLSSIMAVGNFAENYEMAAIKSAGISLRRFILPLVILTLFLSVVDFMFLNYVYPHATLKQKNMFMNIKKKQPALALIPGTFNTDIPGYVIMFDEKYGEKKNLLKNVQISDLKSNVGKVKIITAEKGEIVTEEGSKYMTFILTNGHYYEDHSTRRDKKDKRIKMPFSKATFETYEINIDVSSFSDDNLGDENFKTLQSMLSLNQLTQFSDSTKVVYDTYLKGRSKNFVLAIGADKLKPYPDSLANNNLNQDILKNFEVKNKSVVLDNALRNIERELNNMQRTTKSFKTKRKQLNLYDHEYHNRIAFSLACLVLFFIGAPLGSIIRKGGFGLPMVLAIVIFVVYNIITTAGKNMAEESAISAALGGWLSTLFLLPFGILVTRRAAKDKGIFNIKLFFDSVSAKFKRKKKNS